MKITVKQARGFRGKTQKEVAEYLGIGMDTYRKIEKNPERATIKQGVMIAEFFGFSCDALFFGSDSSLTRDEQSTA